MLSASPDPSQLQLQVHKHGPWETAWRSCPQTQVSTMRLHCCSGRCKGLHRPDLHCLFSAPFRDANSGGWGELLAPCATRPCCPQMCLSKASLGVFRSLRLRNTRCDHEVPCRLDSSFCKPVGGNDTAFRNPGRAFPQERARDCLGLSHACPLQPWTENGIARLVVGTLLIAHCWPAANATAGERGGRLGPPQASARKVLKEPLAFQKSRHSTPEPESSPGRLWAGNAQKAGPPDGLK